MTANAFLSMGHAVVIEASTTSANVANEEPGCEGGLFSNESAAWAWIAFGKDNTVQAVFPVTGTSRPGFALGPGAQATVRMPQEAHYIAAVLRSGSGAITFVPGEGN